jgi:hypothetical protein
VKTNVAKKNGTINGSVLFISPFAVNADALFTNDTLDRSRYVF